MSKNARQLEKILRLRQIFLEETDEENGLTMKQLLERLEAYGIFAERKSIYENIELLNQCGMEILREKCGRSTLYYVAEREFEAAELRLLADAVASSRFITAKKSDQLLRKLAGLTSRRRGAGLRRQVHVPSRIKNMNETIFYSVDELNSAIAEGSAVRFCYYDWVYADRRLQRVPRHGGQEYEVSPWQLLWQDEFYYLIAFDHRACAIRHYRVDRMGAIRQTGQRRQGEEAFKQISMEEYTTRLFGMFGGEPRRVIISFPERLLDVMVDRFGKQVRLQKAEQEGRLLIHADVIPSRPFYAWLFSLGAEVRLDAPEELKKEYLLALRRQLETEE